MEALPILIFFVLILLASLGLMIWALIDISRSEFPENYKLIWILVVLMGGIIGIIVYFAVGRNQKITSESQRQPNVPPGKNPFG